MGLTKYNLDRLRDSENDIKRITKNIDNISGAFKEIYKYIDFDVKMRDNIYGKFNDLIKDIENLVEQTNNADQIINKAIFLYSDGEQQINVLFNGVTDIANMFFDNHKGETKSDKSSIISSSILQKWFSGHRDYFKSEIDHIKNLLDDREIRINNKDYSETENKENSDIRINDLSIWENEFEYTNQGRIKQIQQYIKNKGLNIEVTGKPDRATFQASRMIGVGGLDYNSFIQEDNYIEQIKKLNFYNNYHKNSASFIYPIGYNVAAAANPSFLDGIGEALVGTGTKAISAVKSVSLIGWGVWLFNQFSINAGETNKQIDEITIVENTPQPYIFPREESDGPYVIIDFEVADESIWKEGISIFEKDFDDYIFTSPMERMEKLEIMFANDSSGVYGKGGFLTPKQQNQAYNDILSNKDIKFESKNLAESFIKNKFKNFNKEVAKSRSKEGWHYDSHSINGSENDIDHINIYSKEQGFRVHITWE